MIKLLIDIFCLICTFLCAIFSGSCQENSSEWIEKADSIYASCQFNDAAIACEKAIFFGADGTQIGLLRLKKTDCYKQLGNFKKALKELETIFLPAMPDSVQHKVMYQKALCYYLNHQPQEAEAWLQQYNGKSASPEVLMLEILISSDLLQWEKTKLNLLALIERNHSGFRRDSLRQVYNSIFDNRRIPTIKKEKTATMWSTFLPGAGQFYLGYAGRGTLAFCLTTGSIGLAVFEVLNGMYITGYVVGLGFFQKFYFGGIEQSRRLTKERNSRKIEKYNASIKKLAFSCIN
jgi:TM2 domain-containing membrane protein YozV